MSTVSNQTLERRAPVQRVLIIGGSGYLGLNLCFGLRDHFEVYATYHSNSFRLKGVTTLSLDASQGGEAIDMIKRVQPDVVIYAAGLSSPEACHQERERAELLNVKAPAVFFKIPVRSFHFIYLSTDQVFGAPEGVPPFTETSEVRPTNVFAQSKSQGEAVILAQGRFTHILRLASVFSEPICGGAEVKQGFLGWMRRDLRTQKTVPVYNDQIRSFLYAGDLARAMRAFLYKLPIESSVYHVGAADAWSKYQMAEYLCAKGLGAIEKLRPVASEVFKATPIPRPKNLHLDVSRFSKDFGFTPQTIRQSVDECVQRLKSGDTRSWQ